jgi:hypothetical protein
MKILKPKAGASMRDVRALARGSDVDAVNAYSFRSPQEVEVFLDDMRKQVDDTEIPDQDILGDAEKAVAKLFSDVKVVASHKVEAIKIDRNADPAELLRRMKNKTSPQLLAPTTTPSIPGSTPRALQFINLDSDFSVTNTKKLDAHFDIIKDLHQKLEVLDAMELNIKQAFAGERNALGASIAKTRAAVNAKLKAALGFVSKAAVKKEPRQFAEAVEPAVKSLLERAKGLYKKVEQKSFLFTQKNKDGITFFVFQRHVIFSTFSSGGEDAFTYPTYVVVFTAAVSNERKMSMHITTLHQERPPGTFKFGTVFTSATTALRELDALFDTDKIIDVMRRTPLGDVKLPKEKFAAKQYIQDVTVEDNHVRVRLTKRVPKDPAARQAIIEKVFLDLKTNLGYGQTQSLKYRVVPQADTSLVLDFVVVPSATGKGKAAFDDKQRRILQTHFGMDEQDIQALQRVLTKGF